MSEYTMPPGAISDGKGGWWTTPLKTSWWDLPKSPGGDPAARVCGAVHPRDFHCSANPGHEGMHASSAKLPIDASPRVVAVWR